MSQLQTIKQRFEIIGNSPLLNRALEKAMQVAATDISVLVIGESGVGKEFIPKIIHSLSPRKHKKYIAVNCGAIPAGTIDSELFGHEKGSFTGATQTRKGYFEVADGGTIFLDEVGELPKETQVRLLRVLETGEFIKVGSSEFQKTNVRIVAATNVNLMKAIEKGDFREDLYYRLNTVQIDMPALRDRTEDIALLFKKFSSDFAQKYHMPQIQVTPEALEYLKNYHWPGNVRQLRNFAENISVVETSRLLELSSIKEYLPPINTLPALNKSSNKNENFGQSHAEREILFKFLFDMKKDLNDLRALTLELLQNNGNSGSGAVINQDLIHKVFKEIPDENSAEMEMIPKSNLAQDYDYEDLGYEELPSQDSEPLSLQELEEEMIKKALIKHQGKRKAAADELGISERTLYRKIKQYDI